MRDLEDLLRALSELIDLALYSHFFNRILDLFDVDHALVGKRMEEIEGLDGFLTSLLVAEDEIDPFVQVL
jgi:hypothetical protein